MDGPTLITLATELNGGAAIGDTLLYQFLNIAKAMVEQLRPWMLLRKTDTSKIVAASTSAWQTAIDLSGRPDFRLGDDLENIITAESPAVTDRLKRAQELRHSHCEQRRRRHRYQAGAEQISLALQLRRSTSSRSKARAPTLTRASTRRSAASLSAQQLSAAFEATAHPFDVTFPIHTDIFQYISARFQATDIGYAAINA